MILILMSCDLPSEVDQDRIRFNIALLVKLNDKLVLTLKRLLLIIQDSIQYSIVHDPRKYVFEEAPRRNCCMFSAQSLSVHLFRSASSLSQ